jgi:hypothetical protein
MAVTITLEESERVTEHELFERHALAPLRNGTAKNALCTGAFIPPTDEPFLASFFDTTPQNF